MHKRLRLNTLKIRKISKLFFFFLVKIFLLSSNSYFTCDLKKKPLKKNNKEKKRNMKQLTCVSLVALTKTAICLLQYMEE